MSKHQEHIVAVFANKYNKVAKENPQPNNIYDSKLFESILTNDDIIVAKREHLENDNSFRQVIPYIAFKNEKGEFLTYTRTKNANEARLHKKISVGFGGHMDATDVVFNEESVLDSHASIKECIKREVIEELGDEVYTKIKPSLDKFSISKLIIDDTSEVEEVHMAILIVLSVKSFEVFSEDPSIKMLGFLSKEQIKDIDGDIEPWSEIVISN